MFFLGEEVFIMFNNNIVSRRIAKVEKSQPLPDGPISKHYFFYQTGSFKIMSEKSMFRTKEELVIETFNLKTSAHLVVGD